MRNIRLNSSEEKAIRSFLREKNIPLETALSFADVALPENFSDIRSRSEINNFRAILVPNKLVLNIPIISANMESVTGAEMIVAIEKEGGLGIMPQSLPIERKIEILEKVKRANCALIENPITANPEMSLKEAKEVMQKFNINSLVVVDEKNRPVGILSTRDWLYEENENLPISKLMTRRVITAPNDISFDEAEKILRTNKIEKLPLVDKAGKLAGLITAHGLFYEKHHPRALRNEQGQFIRVGAIGVGKMLSEKIIKDIEAQVEAGITALLIDTARAFSINTEEIVRGVKKKYPELPIIVGNVSTPEGAKFLFELGVDIVKVGIGPGHACTTRMVGVGIPQLTAIAKIGVIARIYGKTIIADGGIRNPGDLAKALIAGADAVMIGYLFAGTQESASPAYNLHIKELGTDIMVKDYFGSASFEAQYRRTLQNSLDKIRRPEGIKRIVPVIGPLELRINDLLDGLRSAMSYIGAKNIQELKEKGKFVPQTSAGFSEGVDKF